MAKYRVGQRHGIPKRLILLFIALVLLLVAAVAGVRHEYYRNLAPLSSDQRTQIVTVQSGSSVKQIAVLLHDQRLIRSAWAFEWYVHSKELSDKLQAGTYAFSPSESIPTIATTLTKGKVETRLVTIIPGRRIDQVRADLINDGFKPSEVDSALTPEKYADLPVLAYKPGNITTLEGLLYPDSFQKNGGTNPTIIIRESLMLMGQKMTPELQQLYASEGLSPYQAIILASIIEQEVSKPSDRAQVAQVFLKRLQMHIPLGSDASNRYGAIVAGQKPSVGYESPYNTRTHTGLPPTPINSVSQSSLEALAHPTNTDWLYFVTGDDGTTYFAHTLAEHEANTQKYCHKLCSQ